MAKPKAATGPPTRRPLNALFLLAFGCLAALSTYLMRVDTVLHEVPVNFHSVIESSTLENGTPVLTRYTGVRAVDEVARFLVAVFLAGTARWDAGVHAQQAYFLTNWFAVVCVWTVESSRRRNAGRLVSFAALFGLVYQIIGAAIIAPLYYAAYVFASGGDAYHLHGREVPIATARALLPAVVLGYLVPTVALYYGTWDLQTVQYLTAFWQPFPILVSALLSLFSFLTFSSSSASATAKNGDVKHLKRVYLLAGLVSAASHLSTLYLSLASDNPQLALSYIFVPNRGSWKDSMVLGIHYIFQIDFIGAYVSTLFWTWLVTYDALRLQGKSSPSNLIQAALGIGFVTLVAGPGAAVVVVCNWREDRLVMIESGVKGNGKKSKAA
ncbi:hypothetical protein F4781DRAFT_394238 [Annulohypoxylon bovei var. microspora]|nr:hypothetical protein F4781DRAFT_394238 [Annulohypoxylon bovei var. microspora]